jgi:YspA, cpYpsA-related SLOG family
MRILVTGSRYWTDGAAVRGAIAEAMDERGILTRSGAITEQVTIVHGSATGADRHAHQWAMSLRGLMVSEPHPANWASAGTAAGPIRNQEMVDLGADVCLAFPLGESRGTRDCMRRAAKAGIPVINYGDA